MTSTTLPNWRLDGRNVLITGGTRGIGRACVEAMLERGANVALIARDRQKLEWTNAELCEAWPDADIHALCMDLSYPEEFAAIGSWLTSFWSQLDVLVNNVGMNIRKQASDYALEEVHQVIDHNLIGCFELCRQLRPLLRRESADRSSSIINISSVAGQTHLRTGVPYAMSKAAMDQMTRNLACEWASDRIRVNSVAPWYIDTPLARTVLRDPEYLQEVLGRTPLGRIGEPAEVASLVCWLAMSGAGFVTGQTIAVDGGFTINGF